MPVKMAEHQLRFWQELLSPFPDYLLSKTSRGGKELTYVDKRAITNRLDSVCGPNGWKPEYEATARGYKCRLSILVPTVEPDVWVWHAKEDGAGFEEMGSYNKKTNEWEADVDNDEKSGYTNALRRAAQDAWGMGRYLYGKGIPTFLDPKARPFEDGGSVALTPAQASQKHGDAHESMSQHGATQRAAQAPAQAAEVRTQAPAQAPKAATFRTDNDECVSEQSTFKPPAPASTPEKPKYDNFKLPRPGKQVFAWCMEMSKVFECELKHGMGRDGEERGWGSKFAEWSEDQVKEICMNVIRHCRELPTYKGQYEYLFPGGAPAAEPIKGVTPGVNLADLRNSLMVKMKALLAKQLDRDPSNAELKSTFENVAASVKNSSGSTGEVPESLKSMTDHVWVANMVKFVDDQIALAVAVPDSEEIPF